MRKMLISKLKSNESWLLAAKQKPLLWAFAMLKANGLPAPSHLTPSPLLDRPFPPASHRLGYRRESRAVPPPPGKVMELLLSPNSVPQSWKK